MKQRRKFAFTVVGVWLALGASAAAQQASPPDDTSACAALDQLREGAPTSRDHQTLDDCVSAMLSSLAEAALSPLTIERGVSDFAADFAAQYRHESNTRAFKEKFAERSSILLHTQLQKGRELRPEMARAVAGAVVVLNSVRSREALLEGLAYPDQVVRYLSAKGLAALRDEIGADARLTGLTLDVIGQAGRREINGVVVAMIYRASAYKDHPAEATGAILRTMDGRLDSMSRSGKDLPLAGRFSSRMTSVAPSWWPSMSSARWRMRTSWTAG